MSFPIIVFQWVFTTVFKIVMFCLLAMKDLNLPKASVFIIIPISHNSSED